MSTAARNLDLLGLREILNVNLWLAGFVGGLGDPAPIGGYIITKMSDEISVSTQNPCRTILSVIESRVENRRSGFSLPAAVDWVFAVSPQSGLT